MPHPPGRLLYLGIKGHVLALDRSSGAEAWRTKLQVGRMRTSDFVYLSLDDDQLYATMSGELFCLDRANGTVRWHNQLNGLGTGLASMVSSSAPSSDGGPASLFARAKRDQAARQSAAT